ncbi:hypothetical protein PLESTB_000236800 [Pleodorina starrii]|uniref:DUF6570 domain-containing protein n=1 Tax=Pleodorina starrii TaxID=330485 RepID=A0A9W6BD25_9CHLO|nr:hypothetical protein PLESTB_000236800 [Pleodorina starrii]
MGFNDPPVFPERNSLFDAAKTAVEQAAAGQTTAAAGSSAQGPQPPLQLDDDSRDALKFRRLLDDHLPLHPCCVCGIRMRHCDLRVHTYLHNVALLQPVLYSTREVDQTVHRLNHTTLWTAPAAASTDPGPSVPLVLQYHLLGDERAGCIRATGYGDADLDICHHCSGSLANGTVPPLSYKAVDNGPRPEHLTQLTMLEERVVAPARVLRHLAICRHAHDRSTSASQVGHAVLRAHIISFNNPGPDSLAAMFPLPPDRVPEIVSVVLVAAAQSEAEIIDLAKRTNALHLRGHVIARWARWLAEVYPHLHDRLDHDAVQQWEEAADSIPRNVLATALHVDTEEEALALGEHQQQRQAGYAAARFGGPEQAAAHGTAGVHTDASAQASVVDDEATAVADANAASAHVPEHHATHPPVPATAPTGSIAAVAPAPGQPDVYVLEFPPSDTTRQPHPEHAAALRSTAEAAAARQHTTLPAVEETPPRPAGTTSAQMHTPQPVVHAPPPPPASTALPAGAQRTPMY